MFLNRLVKIIFGNDDKDKERVDRWKEETKSDKKLTIEHFDKKIKRKKKKKRK